MKKTLIYLTAFLMYGLNINASGSDWLTNFEKATKEATEKKQQVLAVFSGSDWCAWCMKLDSEILSKQEFKDYAKDKLVLFLADFPMKNKLPEETSKQNKMLAEKYNVEGFPTVLLLDASGKVLAKTGYRKAGPAEYIEHLKTLIKN
ncbi:MAG: hypothetical protein A2283_10170 [Lentisphaerae bacterium RIFOXYA12_FULL_48_11]|nr:MAG: hypothetical protein A2283_10170 [Lentisphaerae bacterium RIFOXYA12_FULL_48_11]